MAEAGAVALGDVFSSSSSTARISVEQLRQTESLFGEAPPPALLLREGL